MIHDMAKLLAKEADGLHSLLLDGVLSTIPLLLLKGTVSGLASSFPVNIKTHCLPGHRNRNLRNGNQRNFAENCVTSDCSQIWHTGS